jgi:hypothetical protein
MFRAILETYTNTPATSDKYEPASSQAIPTLSLVRHYSDVFQETLCGAWVETLTISGSGGDEPRVKFDGGALGFAHAGTSTLNGAMSASTTMVVQTADARNFYDGAVVQVGSDTNSGLGYEITVDTARPSFTLASAATASNAAAVAPFMPTETTAGTPINGVSGSITLDGTAIIVTAYEVTIKNGVKPFEDEALRALPSDLVPGYRTVTGSLTLRASKSQILELGKRQAFSGARDIALVLGDTAGSRCTIDLNYVEFGFAGAEIPEAEEGMITLPFTALGSSGNDEIAITFT